MLISFTAHDATLLNMELEPLRDKSFLDREAELSLEYPKGTLSLTKHDHFDFTLEDKIAPDSDGRDITADFQVSLTDLARSKETFQSFLDWHINKTAIALTFWPDGKYAGKLLFEGSATITSAIFRADGEVSLLLSFGEIDYSIITRNKINKINSNSEKS